MVAGVGDESGGETFVAVMQATDFWDGDDSSDAALLKWPGVGAILVERKMRTGALVVVDIRGHNAAQVTLVEDHEVVQTSRRIEPINRST